MNVCLSTEFKTENKLEYHFIPVTSGELNFRVRAPNDAHVALTTGPTLGNPMYEVSIVIVHMMTLNGPTFLVQNLTLLLLQV
jgi:hypothetical protein